MPQAAAQESAYRKLSEMLQRGIYPPGSRLPGERSLAARLTVSRSTLRLVLARLADEHALVASAQRGWFVPQIVLGEPPSMLLSFTEMARSRGLRATATVLSCSTRPATLQEAPALQVAPTAPVVELVRLRGMDAVPVTIETAVLPVSRAGWLVDEELTDRSLYEILEAHGFVLQRSSYTVQAMNADERQAQLLGLATGAAVLVAQDVTYTVDRLPLLTTLNVYRGDAYRFEADLFRSPALTPTS
ncbi:putative Transcriptional regulator, GntR family [Nostocoides japonicum T1-X7]|uniref:Putative Transcriptional regulator, GntR family n=1 Tax=Nostocoides japonicum T1-X7 TaxID=1194083 RepID=A0A077LSN6_9MICO|nr:GntR family transcriptional regulator [Tetrasphaera japonica]CCH76048.1 putative Transcriptional regulator, GntR family [Tetrasphaera japonica T1-X7]